MSAAIANIPRWERKVKIPLTDPIAFNVDIIKTNDKIAIRPKIYGELRRLASTPFFEAVNVTDAKSKTAKTVLKTRPLSKPRCFSFIKPAMKERPAIIMWGVRRSCKVCIVLAIVCEDWKDK